MAEGGIVPARHLAVGLVELYFEVGLADGVAAVLVGSGPYLENWD